MITQSLEIHSIMIIPGDPPKEIFMALSFSLLPVTFFSPSLNGTLSVNPGRIWALVSPKTPPFSFQPGQAGGVCSPVQVCGKLLGLFVLSTSPKYLHTTTERLLVWHFSSIPTQTIHEQLLEIS